MPAQRTLLRDLTELKTVGELRAAAREDAKLVLDIYWNETLVPVDPVIIAKSLGARVFTAEFEPTVYGMTRAASGGAEIYVSRTNPPVRKRFTVARQVGYLVSHAAELTIEGQAFVDEHTSKREATVSDVYADEFASHLLIPPHALTEALKEGTNDIQLAAKFAVPLHRISQRL